MKFKSRVPWLKNVKTILEAVKIDPDEYKKELRAELYILALSLKATGSGVVVGVAIDKFLIRMCNQHWTRFQNYRAGFNSWRK